MNRQRSNLVSGLNAQTWCRVTGPAPQAVQLENSHGPTPSLKTSSVIMLKYGSHCRIFTHCKTGRTVFVSLSSRRSGPSSGVTASCRFFRILVPKIATFSDDTQRLQVSDRLILAVAVAAADGVGACRNIGPPPKNATN